MRSWRSKTIMSVPIWRRACLPSTLAESAGGRRSQCGHPPAPDDGTMYMRRWAVYKAMGETAKAKADWTKGKALMEKAGGQQ